MCLRRSGLADLHLVHRSRLARSVRFPLGTFWSGALPRIRASAAASLAVVDTRGPETPPGAALVTGACAAAGRPVLAAHTGSWQTFASGREPNWRNLMVQYAVSDRFAGISEFATILDRLQ
jgi:hypothetical protein